jgi:hypothetical protein
MSDVKAINMSSVTDKSAHQTLPMAVSICFTPSVGGPAPTPYPTNPMFGQSGSQVNVPGTKVPAVDVSRLRGQLNMLHLQISTTTGVTSSRWLGLLNGYAQTALALYRAGATS